MEHICQQLQPAAGAWGLILPEVSGQSLGKVGQQGLVRLFILSQGAQQQADPLSQHIVYPALSPQKLLHLAGGLQIVDGLPQFLAAPRQLLVLFIAGLVCVPLVCHVGSREQDTAAAVHQQLMPPEQPCSTVGQTDGRLSAQCLPFTAWPKGAVLQQAKKVLSILGIRSGTALEQFFHLAVAQQRLAARMAKQQSGIQPVYGLLDRAGGNLGVQIPPPQQANMDASQQAEQDAHHK